MGKRKSTGINYVYFGFIFLCLAASYTIHILSIDPRVRSLFIFEAIAQCFLGVVLLIFLTKLIRAYLPVFVFRFFLSLTILLFIFYLYDPFLVTVQNISTFTGLKYLFYQMRDSNFSEFLISTRLSPPMLVALFLVLIFAIPATGWLLFSLTEKISEKKRLRLSAPTLGIALLVFSSVLATVDFFSTRTFSPFYYYKHQKILPLKSTFFAPQIEALTPSYPLKPVGQKSLEGIPETSFLLKKRPNIFLFILESAREDFITPEIAPSLSRFREENFAFDLSMSNANCSHISWFTILNSTLPLHWTGAAEITDNKGSLPLQILKKMGYKINVYSSARLNYHNTGERNFGTGCHLIDTYYNAPDCETPDEFDRKTMAKLQEDIKNHPEEGHVHIVFLDGTHSYYYFPEDEPFITPVCPKGGSLMSIYSKEVLEKLKNRYRNALHHLDSLFGNFLTTLEMTKNGKNAVIAVVGDHGEEFFEHGCIFHSSNLSHEQLHIPIYYKFGQNNELPTDSVSLFTSAIDIFPTIFDYLCKSDSLASLFDGESIFRAKTWPYIVSARQNGVCMSEEFSIHNGRYKLHLKFSNLREVFKSPSLYILSVKDLGDNPVPFNPDFLEQEFGPAIQRLFAP